MKIMVENKGAWWLPHLAWIFNELKNGVTPSSASSLIDKYAPVDRNLGLTLKPDLSNYGTF